MLGIIGVYREMCPEKVKFHMLLGPQPGHYKGLPQQAIAFRGEILLMEILFSVNLGRRSEK